MNDTYTLMHKIDNNDVLGGTYFVNVPSEYDEKGSRGLWDIATKIVGYTTDEHTNKDLKEANIYNLLTQLKNELVRYTNNADGKITPEMASEFVKLYETVSPVVNGKTVSDRKAWQEASMFFKEQLIIHFMHTTIRDKTSLIAQVINYDHFIQRGLLHVRFADNSFGINISFTVTDGIGKVKLEKMFSGGYGGTFYHELTVKDLQNVVDEFDDEFNDTLNEYTEL